MKRGLAGTGTGRRWRRDEIRRGQRRRWGGTGTETGTEWGWRRNEMKRGWAGTETETETGQ